MGGGDLNLKKSWHPQTLKNIERVWKAEQKHEAEQKKINELQKELQQERAREEMQRYAESTGAVKKKDDRLDWMYQGPGSHIKQEEYLMGRPVDKYIFEKYEQKESGPSEETGLLPGTIFSTNASNSVQDLAAKIREDPLFLIRKQEEDRKREVLKNPVKMKKIREMLQQNLKKKSKKKDKKKKHKKRHRKSSDSESSSSEDERFAKKSHTRKRTPSPVIHKVPGYGLQVSDRKKSSVDNLPSSYRQREEKSRGSSRSSPESCPPKVLKHSDTRDHREHTASLSSRSKTENNYRHNGKSSSPPKQTYHRRSNSSYTKNLSAEDLEQKRKEMMEFASWRDKERVSNIERYKRQDEKEREVEKKDTRDGKFIHEMKLESASTSSLEDRVKRNIHSIQRTPVALEKSFMKR
ncbi:pre-mRNA-splicing factor CWC25 homolog isoform X2 [Erpetoichthys calabaricus]|uniref:pre-mRNA-splicing factor CWC25 homolog isoform X2 n=1 Tax=Erpetoichthys calabaricus TaxID=27687 RepID=UPI00109F1B05|nr:pre-mRNA-splicing factor CWC25 homolog isoform X2 [Erpetoichthys calabaricus]